MNALNNAEPEDQLKADKELSEEDLKKVSGGGLFGSLVAGAPGLIVDLATGQKAGTSGSNLQDHINRPV